jgi:hypothetical protein
MIPTFAPDVESSVFDYMFGSVCGRFSGEPLMTTTVEDGKKYEKLTLETGDMQVIWGKKSVRGKFLT